uniref:C2H2-type domain-containing protein n=1 Tax=Seriola dumerili TaxID=41447 RepID=A0A3B4UIR6_SERDU
MFNRQCQTKTEPEPESSKSVERNSTLAENSEFSCPECNETFVQGSLLAAHHENEHSKILEAADHQADELVSVDQVPEQVDVGLNGSGSRPSTLKGKAHQCPLCSMTFAKARGLRAHKWQAHSSTTKGKNKVPLSTKKESIPMRSEVRNTEDSSAVDNTTVMSSYLVAKKNSPVDRGRKKIRSAPPPVKSVSCLDCGKQCSSAGALLDHKKRSKPPRCDQCNKDFSSMKSWMSHIDIHKEKPFWCLSCAKGFRDEVSLDKHLQSHSLRQHKCNICHKRFQMSAQLMNHYNTHTGAKPYQCPFCGKTFSHGIQHKYQKNNSLQM